MSLSAVTAVCDRRSALIERRYNLCRSVDGERNRTESPNEKNAAIPRQAQTSNAGQLRARTHQEALSRRRAVPVRDPERRRAARVSRRDRVREGAQGARAPREPGKRRAAARQAR